ncbi:hypothetical protein [Pseudomonas sp. Gutcm_11s]|uniref:hypothetical protein n=1 Tax=Pseudomonas sp. Gutcm_11s TaxID=3026088 RepID=UPI00235EB8A1|nr:hypothetical protein [Pseudomonas sp. Gutcm_11s]MDD0844958.1 hypothetical protein [Pseudomonas sp. Gutcm_11s]
MHTVHLSLFCAAALLVNGAYAKDFADTAGASAKTAEMTLQSTVEEARGSSALLQQFGEIRRQAAEGARQDGRWLRIADDETDTAVRQPQTLERQPRWVF